MITLNEVRFEMNSEDSREVNLKYDENKGTMRWAGGRNFGILRWWFVSCGYFLNIASSQSYEWLIMKNYKSQIKDDF